MSVFAGFFRVMRRRYYFMAINSNFLRRPSDRNLYLAAAVAFPLLVFIGYFKTYYFRAFFDVPPVANSLVHLHGVVMSAWVIFFVVQFALIRTKNIKLHLTMGMMGIALAALVVIVGMATAYDSNLVRNSAPPGIDPHKFFLLPAGDMLLFVIYFAGAIYYRKRPVEHKALMLLTAINFLPAALFRVPLLPAGYEMLWAFGAADLLALGCLIWHTRKHGKLNKVFAIGVALFVAAIPARMMIGETEAWLRFTAWLAP
jgi:hypothetical protein